VPQGDRFDLGAAVEAGADVLVVLGGTVESGATQKVDVGKIRVPPGAKAGTYYLAFFLRDPKDTWQANNGSWSTEEVTLTVTRK
jgi:hypothetical protein